MPELSPRQKAAAEYERIHGPEGGHSALYLDDAGERAERRRLLNTPEALAQESREIDELLRGWNTHNRRYGAYNRDHNGKSIDPRKWWSIRVVDSAPKPRGKPLPPALEAKFQKLVAWELNDLRYQRRRLENELARRNGMSADHYRTLAQIESQPDEHRAAIGCLYLSWAEISSRFFDNKLGWPEISATDQSSLARCHRKGPLRIEFAPRTLHNFQQNAFKGNYGILLHEAIHSMIAREKRKETLLDEITAGHGERFTELANKVNRELGLPILNARTGKASVNSPCYWPMNVEQK